MRRVLVSSLLATLWLQMALLISGIVAARLLGVEDRGHLALIALIPAVVGQIATLGVPFAVTYELARDRTASAGILAPIRGLIMFQIVIGVAVEAVLLGVLVHGEPPRVAIAAVIGCAYLPASVLQQYALAILQGSREYRLFNRFRVAPAALYAAAVALVFAFDLGGLPTVAGVWVASTVVVTCGTVAAARRVTATGKCAVHAPRDLLRFGLRGLLGSASPIDSLRIDQAVVGVALSPAALGLYVVAAAFTNLPRIAAQAIGAIAYPQVANYRNRTVQLRAMWYFIGVGVATTAMIVACLEVGIGFLVTAFFGNRFEDAVSVARVLLLGAFAFGVRRVVTDCARGIGAAGAGSVAEVTSWFVLVPGLLLGAERFGLAGVAWAVTASGAASAVVAIGLTARRTVGLARGAGGKYGLFESAAGRSLP